MSFDYSWTHHNTTGAEVQSGADIFLLERFIAYVNHLCDFISSLLSRELHQRGKVRKQKSWQWQRKVEEKQQIGSTSSQMWFRSYIYLNEEVVWFIPPCRLETTRKDGFTKQWKVQSWARTKWSRPGKPVSHITLKSGACWLIFDDKWLTWLIRVFEPGTMGPRCQRSSGWSAASSPTRWTLASGSTGWKSRERKQGGWSTCTL